MEIKVLFTRGEEIYIVEHNKLFYLVNTETEAVPLKSKFAESFLKFGYFTEVGEISDEILEKIKERLLNFGGAV